VGGGEEEDVDVFVVEGEAGHGVCFLLPFLCLQGVSILKRVEKHKSHKKKPQQKPGQKT